MWAQFPFVRYVCAFILGILFYDTFLIDITISLASCVFFWLILWLVRFFGKPAFRRNHGDLLGVCGLLGLFFFASFVSFLHDPTNDSDHLLHHGEKIEAFAGVLQTDCVEKSKHNQALLSLTAVKTADGWQKKHALVQLYLDTAIKEKLLYGDQVLVNEVAIMPIKSQANPDAFDFAAYMAGEHIYHQAFLRETSAVLKLDRQPTHLFIDWALRFRRYASETFDHYITNKQLSGIVKALVLGIKDDLDADVLQAYRDTGATHVLAVSGLHVGILCQVLLFLLGFLNKKKNGKVLLFLLVLSILWAYAFITGLSPSVLRAATMFSFVLLAQTIGKRSNIYNTLAISALLLLFFDPTLLYKVGFQLSYLAVVGIVYLQPKIYALVLFKNKVFDWVWQLTAVALAAQIATSPISLYYFHQFPTFFFLSNLLVIPLGALVLQGGLLLLVFSFIPLIASGIAYILQFFIYVMNLGVSGLSNLPFSTISGVYITDIQTILLYLALCCMLLFLVDRSFKTFCFSSSFFIIFVISFTYQKYIFANASGWVLWPAQKHSVLTFFEQGAAYKIPLTVDSVQVNKRFVGEQFFAKRAIRFVDQLHHLHVRTASGYQLFHFSGKNILWVYEHAPEQIPSQIDYLVVSNRTIVSPEALDSFNNTLILDLSNPYYLYKRFEQANLAALHNVKTQGAYSLFLD